MSLGRASPASTPTPGRYSCSRAMGASSKLYLGRDQILRWLATPGIASRSASGWQALRRSNSREPIFIESDQDVRDHYPPVLERPDGLRIRAGAHIPLLLSGRLLGVLFLGFSKPRTFSPSQRRFVLALASQCAQALGRAQLYEAELEERARLSRLIEALHEGIVSVDRGGHIEFANATARRMVVGDPLERGRRIPEKWLGFPLRAFAASLFDADERLEVEVAGLKR